MKDTPLRPALGGRGVYQVWPPSLVMRTRPFWPTAMPTAGLKKATPFRFWLMPLACLVQVEPPLDVARIRPFWPTAQPCWGSEKNTPVKF